MRLLRACISLAFLTIAAGLVQAGQSVQIAADSGSAVEAVATSKNLSLVVPERVFRRAGDSSFSTPYLAELHVTTDAGKTWKSLGLSKDLDKPIDFTADEEGRYGFFITLIDRKGNADVSPVSGSSPMVTVLFDWTPPMVTVQTPSSEEVVGAGKPVTIAWQASDDFLTETPISIKSSTDGGKTWQFVARAIENTGSYQWLPPAAFSGRVQFRVLVADEGGHSSSSTIQDLVVVDAESPIAVVTGPALAASGEVTLDVKAEDSLSGLSEIRLWSTLDNGATWAPAGEFAAGQPVVFRSTSGTYGLFASAVDKAGNTSPQPRPGDAPQATLAISTNSPLVHLKTLTSGGAIAGGTRALVEWEAVAPSVTPRGITVFLSPDGGATWTAVASDIANSGSYLWDVPRINTDKAVLKVAYTDASGVTGAATSKVPFTIDSTRPSSAIGVSPVTASGDIADLSTVMRPMSASRPAAPARTAPAADAGTAAIEASVPQVLSGERVGAESASAATVSLDTGIAAGGDASSEIAYTPQPTPAVSAPWTEPQPQAYGGAPGASATVEEVILAGEMAYDKCQLAVAKDLFLRAAQMAPNNWRAHAWLGKVYAREGGVNYTAQKQSFEAALYEFGRALILGADDANIHNDMGFIFLRTERYKDAENAFRKAATALPQPLFLYNLGVALYKQGDIAGATDAFRKALEIDPARADAAFYMGLIASAARDWQAAKDYWRTAVDGYGPESRMGKIALDGLTRAQENLGEIQTPRDKVSLTQTLDRLR